MPSIEAAPKRLGYDPRVCQQHLQPVQDVGLLPGSHARAGRCLRNRLGTPDFTSFCLKTSENAAIFHRLPPFRAHVPSSPARQAPGRYWRLSSRNPYGPPAHPGSSPMSSLAPAACTSAAAWRPPAVASSGRRWLWPAGGCATRPAAPAPRPSGSYGLGASPRRLPKEKSFKKEAERAETPRNRPATALRTGCAGLLKVFTELKVLVGEEKGGGCPARHATAATGSPGLTLRALAEGSGGEGMAGKAACKPETAVEKELKRATEGSPEASLHLQRRCRQNEHEPAGLKESDGRGRRMR